MSKPVGGRGKKAPYETKTLRVPLELLPEFEDRINEYRAAVIEGVSVEQTVDVSTQKHSTLLEFTKAVEEAKRILKGKRSAKVSLIKLLQVIYSAVVTEKDLD
jgi:hypothetical protein